MTTTNSETTKAFYVFVQNKLHYAVTGKTAAELISERANLDSPTMGLTTWKGAPDGKGHISREAAAKKVGAIYEEFRKKQDAAYISEFDRQTEQYLKGECK